VARNEQLIRQHKILQILERSRFGRTLAEIRQDLIDELGLNSLHERSVRRDMDALQSAGLDIQSEQMSRGRVWKLGPQIKQVHHISASATELIALSLGRDLLYPLAGTPFWIGIESFWNKMREELPDAVWKHYERYRKALYVRGMPNKSYQRQHGILKTLHRAVVEHRVVQIEYERFGRPKQQRLIEPYAVVFYHGSLYIIAADHELPRDATDRIRHWKLDRFSKGDGLDEWFVVPDGFDLEEHLSRSVGIFSSDGRAKRFQLRLTAQAARWVQEDPWHPQQRLEAQEDGSYQLTVDAAHEMEILPRILALGVNAELLGPAAARQQLGEMLKEMARKYEKSD
jgi:predicted DNA-binding transcriptional regulator YafY